MPCEVIVEIKPQGVNVRTGLPVAKEYITRGTFIHEQDIPSAEWTIHHNMNTYPSVTVIDSAGSCVIGSVQYVDANAIVCSFSWPFSGKAYLN